MVHVVCMFYIEIHFYKLALRLRSFTLVVMDLVTFPKLKIVEGLPGHCRTTKVAERSGEPAINFIVFHNCFVNSIIPLFIPKYNPANKWPKLCLSKH